MFFFILSCKKEKGILYFHQVQFFRKIMKKIIGLFGSTLLLCSFLVKNIAGKGDLTTEPQTSNPAVSAQTQQSQKDIVESIKEAYNKKLAESSQHFADHCRFQEGMKKTFGAAMATNDQDTTKEAIAQIVEEQNLRILQITESQNRDVVAFLAEIMGEMQHLKVSTKNLRSKTSKEFQNMKAIFKGLKDLSSLEKEETNLLQEESSMLKEETHQDVKGAIGEAFSENFTQIMSMVDNERRHMLETFLSADGEKAFGLLKDGIEGRVNSLMAERLKTHEDEKVKIKEEEQVRLQESEKKAQELQSKIDEIEKLKISVEQQLKDSEFLLSAREKTLKDKDHEISELGKQLFDLTKHVVTEELTRHENLTLKDRMREFDMVVKSKEDGEKALQELKEKMDILSNEKSKEETAKKENEKVIEEKDKKIAELLAEMDKMKADVVAEKEKSIQSSKDEFQRIRNDLENRIEELKDSHKKEKEKLMEDNKSLKILTDALENRVKALEPKKEETSKDVVQNSSMDVPVAPAEIVLEKKTISEFSLQESH